MLNFDEKLISMKKIMLNEIIQTFIKNIFDKNVKKKIIKNQNIDKFLSNIYNIAKNAKIFKQQLIKFQKKDIKNKKIKFYEKFTFKHIDQNKLIIFFVNCNFGFFDLNQIIKSISFTNIYFFYQNIKESTNVSNQHEKRFVARSIIFQNNNAHQIVKIYRKFSITKQFFFSVFRFFSNRKQFKNSFINENRI